VDYIQANYIMQVGCQQICKKKKKKSDCWRKAAQTGWKY